MFPRIDKGPIEYTLDIYPAFNVEEQRDCLRFRFRTTEEFNHFRYRIAIDEKHDGGGLRFTLRGLKAKGLLPGVGSAETAVDLFDLRGTYDVTVMKPGDVTNSFRVGIGDNGPRLVKDIQDERVFMTVHISNEHAGRE
ncbi:MAG: hypothetical protein RBU27_02410 [Bacteroidota bacterium]|jgi:hypothetical protein|nr:hypothetical protein [Bacteroidota bacterium]